MYSENYTFYWKNIVEGVFEITAENPSKAQEIFSSLSKDELLNKSKLKEIKIQYTKSLEEQKRIAAILDKDDLNTTSFKCLAKELMRKNVLQQSDLKQTSTKKTLKDLVALYLRARARKELKAANKKQRAIAHQ